MPKTIIVIKDGEIGVFGWLIGLLPLISLGLISISFPFVYIHNFPSTWLFVFTLSTFIPIGLLLLWVASLAFARIDKLHIDQEKQLLINSSRVLWYPEHVSTLPLHGFTEIVVDSFPPTKDGCSRLSSRAKTVYLKSRQALSCRNKGIFKPLLLELDRSGDELLDLETFRKHDQAVKKAKEIAEATGLLFRTLAPGSSDDEST